MFPLTDERQSIVGVWNESQTKLVEYRQYDADGRLRVRDNQDQIICDEQQFDADTCNADWIERFGYTGAMRSTYTGLHRFGQRRYASQVGQFLRTDPLWYVDSPDMYGYVGFDPINRWDPTGLAAESLGWRLNLSLPDLSGLGGLSLPSFDGLSGPEFGEFSMPELNGGFPENNGHSRSPSVDIVGAQTMVDEGGETGGGAGGPSVGVGIRLPPPRAARGRRGAIQRDQSV